MGLRRRLAQAAVRRASVLVVEVPGWAATRFALERAVRERGWRPALSPADADVLVTCGAPGRRLSAALDLVWEQLPGPRARVPVTRPADVGATLDRAATALLDDDAQRREAAARPTGPVMGIPADDGADDGDHGDHMDHGDMDMPMPGGIPLAGEGGEERDDLALDVLHLPLGPVLPHWPAGLVLHCTVHGDVLGEVRAEVLPAADDAAPDGAPGAAAHRLDRAARVLALAGWAGPAATAARLRDDAHTGADPAACLRAVDRLTAQVLRSRVLRWSLRGIGRIEPEVCRRHGLDRRLAGDVLDRLAADLADARSALAGDAAASPVAPPALLPALLPGLEIGAVRLVVAGLDLDARAPRPTAAGAA